MASPILGTARSAGFTRVLAFAGLPAASAFSPRPPSPRSRSRRPPSPAATVAVAYSQAIVTTGGKPPCLGPDDRHLPRRPHPRPERRPLRQADDGRHFLLPTPGDRQRGLHEKKVSFSLKVNPPPPPLSILYPNLNAGVAGTLFTQPPLRHGRDLAVHLDPRRRRPSGRPHPPAVRHDHRHPDRHRQLQLHRPGEGRRRRDRHPGLRPLHRRSALLDPHDRGGPGLGQRGLCKNPRRHRRHAALRLAGLPQLPAPGPEAVLRRRPQRDASTLPGDYSFQIMATDANWVAAFVTYDLYVNWRRSPSRPRSLPGGSTGASYAQTRVATGGFPPCHLDDRLRALPPGPSLSTAGVISGTPTTVGTSAFTVTANDSHSGPVSRKSEHCGCGGW